MWETCGWFGELQAITLRKYPAEMSLATWVCFVGALQSSVVAVCAERHRPHAWSLGWDIRLFAPAYAVSAYSYGLMGNTKHIYLGHETSLYHWPNPLCTTAPTVFVSLRFIKCFCSGNSYLRSPILHSRHG